MKTPKPILTIQEKCKYCNGERYEDKVLGLLLCAKCDGKGTQTTEITPLREFKCGTCNGQGGWYIGNEETGEGDGESCQDCKGTGYKIPKEYEPYEIKKVSEIECKYGVPKGCCYKDCWQCDLIHEYNLKEDDKIIVRVK